MKTEILIAKRYKIIQKKSEGAFGQIYQAFDINTGQQLAVKLEKSDAKHPQLIVQANILKNLLNDSTVTNKGIPNLYFSGQQGDFNVLVMDLLGKNLEELFSKKCESIFSIKTVLMLATQMFKRIQYIHSKGYLHRDIKPENFMMGIGKNKRKLYIIDFGLSKKYIKKNKHIQYSDGKGVNGTVRYVSTNTHLGIEPSRRDDLQSIMYIIYYFLYGRLPWQGISAPSKKQKYDKIMILKIQIKPQLWFSNLPSPISQELGLILKHIKDLKFQEKPNYQFIHLRIKECFKKQKIQYDYLYDWTVKQENQSKFKKPQANRGSIFNKKSSSFSYLPYLHNSANGSPQKKEAKKKKSGLYDSINIASHRKVESVLENRINMSQNKSFKVTQGRYKKLDTIFPKRTKNFK